MQCRTLAPALLALLVLAAAASQVAEESDGTCALQLAVGANATRPHCGKGKGGKGKGGKGSGGGNDCAAASANKCPASDNVEDAFYCSPFDFVPYTADYQSCKAGAANAKDYLNRWAGGTERAQAWCEKGNPNPDNYFVIHSCDGSGIQTDCVGDEWYVELFGQWATSDYCLANDGSAGQGFDCVPSASDLGECQHQKCTFRHPMTGHNYEYYSCGWWGVGSYGDSLGGKPVPDGQAETWMNNQPGLRDANSCDGGDLSQCNNWNVFLNVYAWTCHYDTPGQGLQYFTGSDTRNCYCDNEPWGLGQHGKPDAQSPSAGTMLNYVGRYFDEDDTIGLSKVNFDGSHDAEQYFQKCEAPW